MKHIYCQAVLILIGVFHGAGCTQQRSAVPVRPNEAAQITDPFNPDRPPSAKTLYITAEILSVQGREQDAERMLTRILNDSPDFLPAYNRLAELQMRNRRISEATKTLSAGLSIHPNDAVLLNNMGMCWLIRKNYQQALDYFTKASSISPENTRYRSNMATTLVLMNRHEEALALYEQVIQKDQAIENIQILSGSMPFQRNYTSDNPIQ